MIFFSLSLFSKRISCFCKNKRKPIHLPTPCLWAALQNHQFINASGMFCLRHGSGMDNPTCRSLIPLCVSIHHLLTALKLRVFLIMFLEDGNNGVALSGHRPKTCFLRACNQRKEDWWGLWQLCPPLPPKPLLSSSTSFPWPQTRVCVPTALWHCHSSAASFAIEKKGIDYHGSSPE